MEAMTHTGSPVALDPDYLRLLERDDVLDAQAERLARLDRELSATPFDDVDRTGRER